MNQGILRDFKIKVQYRGIYRRLGVSRKKDISSSIQTLIKEGKEQMDRLIRPVSLYAVLDYKETNQHPIFDNAEKVALCLCTIGQELENESARLMEQNELLKGLILDSFGSESVESVAILSDDYLSKKAGEMGFWPSKRYSPGYHRWPLEEQKFIFQTLPASEIKVSLTKSLMMVPRKSISFMINFYKERKYSTRKKFDFETDSKTG